MNTACYSAVIGMKRALERSDRRLARSAKKWVEYSSKEPRNYYAYFMGFSLAEWVGLDLVDGSYLGGGHAEEPTGGVPPHQDTLKVEMMANETAKPQMKPIEKDRKFLAGGNFKMNGNKKDLESIAKNLGKAKLDPNAEVFVCPPSVYMETVKKSLPKSIAIGAQNCYWKEKGAFTGEVSPSMIKDVGGTWVILGHSERRLIMGENDNLIGEKICRALHEGLKVVACVGETQKERDQGKMEDVIIEQLENIASHCCGSWSNLVIAYEPVWAIGTGISATPEDAEEAHCIIRSWIRDNVGECASDIVRIIYGGSVTKDNCLELIKMPDVDGFLVGGASLKPEFIDIINVISDHNKEAAKREKEEKKKFGK